MGMPAPTQDELEALIRELLKKSAEPILALKEPEVSFEQRVETYGDDFPDARPH